MNLLSTVLLSALLVQDPAAKAIDLAVSAYSKIRTSRATFEQTITNPLTGSTLKSRGEFEQERPNRFVFRFSEPKGDIVVSDGHNVWLYLPSSAPGQVIKSPLAANAAGSLDLVGEFFTNRRARYTISDGGAATIDGHAVRIVLLAPKAKDAAFTRAKVWIDAEDGSLRQFEAEEQTGVVRLVRITSYVANATVRGDSFAFKPPRGVRVVER